MSLKCPKCHIRTLSILDQKEMDPGSQFDERSIQILACSKCIYIGIGIYEESRRGSLNSESVSHIAYDSPIEKVRELKTKIFKNESIDIHHFIYDKIKKQLYTNHPIIYVRD